MIHVYFVCLQETCDVNVLIFFFGGGGLKKIFQEKNSTTFLRVSVENL